MKRPLILAVKDKSGMSEELLSQLANLGFEVREEDPLTGESASEDTTCAPSQSLREEEPAAERSPGHSLKLWEAFFAPSTPYTNPAHMPEQDRIAGRRSAGVEETRPRQAEEALERANDLWQRTFDAVPDLVAIIDTNHRIVRANKAMAERIGMGGLDPCGLYCYEYVHGIGRPPEFCPHAKLILDGKSRSVEFKEDRLGGAFHVTVSPIFDADGGILGSVHVARDITESKLAAEKQNELMDELKTFTYIMSHDLRAPLANLKGFARELEESLAEAGRLMKRTLEALPEESRSKLETHLQEDIPEAMHFINSSVSRIDRIVEAILGLSRLGRRQLESEPLDMNEVVREALDSMAFRINDATAQVTVEDLPEIEADRASMEQIFGNLLDNAIKYLDPGRHGKIEVKGSRKGHESEFHIVDNGVGIERESLARVFHIFQRGRNVKVAGEGMGLARVRTLVRAHGGRIWVKSTPGEGSDFGFTISKVAHDQSSRDGGV